MTTARTAACLAAVFFFLVHTIAAEETCPETSICHEKDVIIGQKVSLRFSADIPANMFHVAANGDHEGWLVRVPRQGDGNILPCHLRFMKRMVAREIVKEYEYGNDSVRDIDLRGPHRLVDEEGNAFPHDSESNRLHLFLPREAFIHEAVEEGFVRTLSDGVTKLTTLSVNHPRVFLVEPMLSHDDCEELIQIGSQTLQTSPEKHYSDEYKNYRTSWTGRTPWNSPVTRKLWNQAKYVTAMPDGGVEHPQLLKYDTDTSWYKQHHDFYHNYGPRPLEEVRMFVQTRARELIRWNVSSEVTEALKDELSVDRFDLISQRMSNELTNLLVMEALNIDSLDGVSPQRQLHDYLITSEDPVETFRRVAVAYASQLLQAHGATGTNTLEIRYFQLEGVPTNATTASSMYDLEDYVSYALKPIQSNRHVTVLPILRAADRGGNTAFPRAVSNQMGVQPDKDEEFEECKHGLIVKAETGQALMFYNRLPRGDLDYSTIHAGCPPKEGEKFAVNCFTWDSDQNWAFKFLTDIDRLY